jgi:hypothetical protein
MHRQFTWRRILAEAAPKDQFKTALDCFGVRLVHGSLPSAGGALYFPGFRRFVAGVNIEADESPKFHVRQYSPPLQVGHMSGAYPEVGGDARLIQPA